MTDHYCDGGPVPATPAEFAAQVQAIVIDPRLTSGVAIDIQLGQLAVAYADELIPGGLRRLEGPWSKAAATGDEITKLSEEVRQLAARLDERGRAVLAAQLIGSIGAGGRLDGRDGPERSSVGKWSDAAMAQAPAVAEEDFAREQSRTRP